MSVHLIVNLLQPPVAATFGPFHTRACNLSGTAVTTHRSVCTPLSGIIDDLIILPALFWLAFVLIPEPVLAAARKRAESEPLRLSRNIVAGVIFLLVWLASFETAAALLVEHWPFARTHSVAVYIIATLGFFMFAVAGILSESEEARSALQRIACCCERAMPLAEPLLPTTSAH